MATFSRGQTFGATETVTNTKLHNLIDLATITNIVDADISPSAAIQFSKLLASSISGALFTNLDLVPSSAGRMPYANLGLPSTGRDYGISASSSTTIALGNLRFCYGKVDVAGSGGTQAITNLPFSDSSSYIVTVNTVLGSAAQDPGITYNSGSQFTITNNESALRTISWIAIGT